MNTISFCFILAFGFTIGTVAFFFAERVTEKHDDKSYVSPYLAAVAIVFFCIGAVGHLRNPKAIDVYRGNTKLEITSSEDGVPIDSTVIYKEDFQYSK